MAYSIFGDMLATLERMGIMDVILPFILVFTLVFATLQKTKILGDKKNFNVIIALALALGVVIPHATNTYPPGADVVDIINSAMPQIALFLIILLAVMILIGLFGVGEASRGLKTIITIAAFIAVITVFASSAGFFEFGGFFNFLDNPETQALIIILLVFGLIVGIITGEDKEKGKTGFEKLMDLVVGQGGEKK